MEKRRKSIIANKANWGDSWCGNVGRDDTCPECSSDNKMGSLVHPISPATSNFTCKEWTLESLLSRPNFRPIPRLSVLDKQATSRAIDAHDKQGIPYIIERCQDHSDWESAVFTPEWLKKNGPKEPIDVRNIHTYDDTQMPLDEFISRSRNASPFTEPMEKERYYGKDVECPPEWSEWLSSKVIPARLLPGSEQNLLKNLPHDATVETLMCYLGIGDTFTPSHKDPCGSSGHNLMCYTENNGSSFWFMTKSEDAREVTNYFQTLKQELDHETHVTSVDEFANAPFTVYVAEQKLGDLVLVPPRSCHQVVNRGGITMKISWSRMTIRGLVAGFYHELPLYRRVCRQETYRVKSTLYHTIRKLTKDLAKRTLCGRDTSKFRNLTTLCVVFDQIIMDEHDIGCDSMHSLSHSHDDVCTMRCDFCGADIFQSFFACRNCVKDEVRGGNWEDACIICPGCYVEGRSCRCRNMTPLQFREFNILKAVRKEAYDILRKGWSTRIDSMKKPTRGFEAEENLFTGKCEGTFRSACLLAKERENLRSQSRSCSLGTKAPSHPVPLFGAIRCKECHRIRCIRHLLKHRMHAQSLIWRREHDPTGHHRHHSESKHLYDSKLDYYKNSERNGQKPNSEIQLVDLALAFRTCKPFNPQFLTLGWYDERFISLRSSTITSMPSITDVPQVSAPSSSKSRTQASGSSLTSAITLAYSGKGSAAPGHRESAKRKPLIMDCILLPSVSRVTSKGKERAPSMASDLASSINSAMIPFEDDATVETTPRQRQRPSIKHSRLAPTELEVILSSSEEVIPEPGPSKRPAVRHSRTTNSLRHIAASSSRPHSEPALSNSAPAVQSPDTTTKVATRCGTTSTTFRPNLSSSSNEETGERAAKRRKLDPNLRFKKTNQHGARARAVQMESVDSSEEERIPVQQLPIETESSASLPPAHSRRPKATQNTAVESPKLTEQAIDTLHPGNSDSYFLTSEGLLIQHLTQQLHEEKYKNACLQQQLVSLNQKVESLLEQTNQNNVVNNLDAISRMLKPFIEMTGQAYAIAGFSFGSSGSGSNGTPAVNYHYQTEFHDAKANVPVHNYDQPRRRRHASFNRNNRSRHDSPPRRSHRSRHPYNDSGRGRGRGRKESAREKTKESSLLSGAVVPYQGRSTSSPVAGPSQRSPSPQLEQERARTTTVDREDLHEDPQYWEDHYEQPNVHSEQPLEQQRADIETAVAPTSSTRGLSRWPLPPEATTNPWRT